MHYQLRIELLDVEPPIWRRILVPSEFTLHDLHYAIQIAMGWEDCHLHDFTIKRQRYTVPDLEDFDDPQDERDIRLCDVIRSRSKFVYQYDFGDSWNHSILVERVVHDVALTGPVCVDGARACPPEDSGGPWGYAEKLHALADPDDEEYDELREWIGTDFDAELFRKEAINKILKRSFRPPKAMHTKGRTGQRS
jgi:hypothetical protein